MFFGWGNVGKKGILEASAQLQGNEEGGEIKQLYSRNTAL